MKRFNQPCYNKEGEFLGWFSPSVAVCTVVFYKTPDNIYVAATKRGPGCPNNVGKWNCQCGFLDFNESLPEAAKREVYEETGIELDNIKYWKTIGIPDENGNIVIRFIANITEPSKAILSPIHSEKDEVSDLKWINVKNINKYDWAFNHDQLIKEALYE